MIYKIVAASMAINAVKRKKKLLNRAGKSIKFDYKKKRPGFIKRIVNFFP